MVVRNNIVEGEYYFCCVNPQLMLFVSTLTGL